MRLRNHGGLFAQTQLDVNGSADLETEATAFWFTAAESRQLASGQMAAIAKWAILGRSGLA